MLLSPIDFLEIPEPFVNRQRQPRQKRQSRRGGTGSRYTAVFFEIWAALRINNPMPRSLRVRRQRSRRASEHRDRLDRLAFAIETTPVRPAVATLMREHPR